MPTLIDTERRRHTPSGLQFFCDNLLSGLSELHATDIEVYGPEPAFGFPVHSYSPLHKLFNPLPKRFSLLHVTHQNQGCFPGKFGEKRILTVHDLNYLHLEETNPKTKAAFIKQVAKNIDSADHIVCISEYTKKDLLANARYFPSLSDKPVTVIHNGLPVDPAYPAETLRRNLPTELRDTPYILNIGVSHPKKNQQAIIEALPRLDMDVVLVVNDAQNGYARYLKSRAAELGVLPRLHFFEHVSDEVKHALLAHCEVMIYPSIIEGFGYPPAEAMVYGRQVILSKNGSLPEVGGEVAFYMEDDSPWSVEEAFRKMQSSPVDAQSITKWVRRFSYQKMASSYLELYRALS